MTSVPCCAHSVHSHVCPRGIYFGLYSSRIKNFSSANRTMSLRYKPEGHGFDSLWCHWRFFIYLIFSCRTIFLGLTQPVKEISTRNISWG